MMRMPRRKTLLSIALALVAAFAICSKWPPIPYVEQLVRIQAKEDLAHIDDRILDEPVEVQAVLLDYAGESGENRMLTLKAWLALEKYGPTAREILLLYGAEPEFKAVLAKYGEPIIPVIQYFRDNDVRTLAAMQATSGAIDAARDAAQDAWNRMTGKEPVPRAAPVPARPALGPTERGWYAIGFIRDEGFDFLAQFTELGDRTVRWNQTDRTVKAVTSLFTSGIRTLETRHDLGQATAGDVGWATLDVALIAAPLKLLRAGKLAARSGEEMGIAYRTRTFAPRLVARTKLFRGLGTYGVMAATVFVVVTHPSLINSLLGEAASLVGIDPMIAQFAGWFVIIGLLLYPLSWLLRGLGRVALFLAWLSRPRGVRQHRYGRGT